jgi:ABC-type multidrug transport system fused ATPase/permease subunit
MLKAVSASLRFMNPGERIAWFLLVASRSLLAVLDLAGILAIGFIVTSTAIFLTEGSNPNRVLEFAGFLIPAVSAQTLPWVSALVLALFLTKALLSIILTRKAAFFVARVEARSARTIAQISFNGDIRDARLRSREELMFAIQGGSPAAFNGLLNATSSFLTEATLFLVICLGFLFVDPMATLAAVVYFGLIAFVIQIFIGSLMNRAAQVATKGSIDANTAISDLIAVYRELLVIGKREKYINRIYSAREAASQSAASSYYLGGMPRYVIEAALMFGVAAFVLAQSLSGDIVESAGAIGVFLAGGFRLTAAMLPLQNALLSIRSTIPAAQKAHEILDKQHKQTPDEHQEKQISRDGKQSESGPIGLHLDSVSFAFPNADVEAVRNVSFDIQAGTQVALMGPSGAGKSTLADLICNVLYPTSGSISRLDANGQLIPEHAGVNVGYVPQKPGMVSGTILENVAIGVEPEEIDRERVLESLTLAHLKKLIKELPNGIDTHLGKLQDGLSGGQMQRLGLARALYMKPKLLVMDEATSALDAESESEIQKALDGMRGKVTVVLIAHRLNTIQHADNVVLIEEGQVRDSGTFKQLVSRNPSVERVVDLMKVEKA